MAPAVKPIPEGFHTVSPHMTVKNADEAIEFYRRAFNAEPAGIHRTPDGKVMHARLKIGDSVVMLVEEFPEMGVLSPLSQGGASSVTLHLYVEDVDTLWNQAVAAGATVAMPLANQFWGDRYGHLVDPFGHKWSLATHIRDLSDEEIEKAGQAAMAQA